MGTILWIFLILMGLGLLGALWIFLGAARQFVSQRERAPVGGAETLDAPLERRAQTERRQLRDRRRAEVRADFPLVDSDGNVVEHDRRRTQRRSGFDRRAMA